MRIKNQVKNSDRVLFKTCPVSSTIDYRDRTRATSPRLRRWSTQLPSTNVAQLSAGGKPFGCSPTSVWPASAAIFRILNIGITPSITPNYLGEGTQCLVCVFFKKKIQKRGRVSRPYIKTRCPLKLFFYYLN